ncbi:uncharacterized protein METZ01_LOCUS147575 [marine metagenome]|uniref:Glycosyltransferase 2-like domain-containing protein n=1 Tax=marine metagenome TaxID=408172 RepID=A0A382A0G5_9ZZZZ
MIVRDEENSLTVCLNSVKDIVDQMVIIDTGSKDKTMQIAKNLGADVYQYQWCDSFSEARNESIKYANGDWILWMDADETLDPKSIPELKKITHDNNKDYFYSVRISSKNNYQNKVTYSDAHRLFPSGLGIQFVNRIHEQIYHSAISAGAREKITGIHIFHEGYNLTEKEYKKKLLRNLPLLEKMVEEDRQNSYAHFTLAQNYSGLKQYKNAIKHFKIAIQSDTLGNSLTMDALNVMSQAYSYLEEWEKAKKYSMQSIKLNPVQSGAYYMLYKYDEHQNNYQQAVEHLTFLLQNTKKLNSQPQNIKNDVLVSEHRIIKTLGDTYVKIGRQDKAFEFYSQLTGDALTKSIVWKIIHLTGELGEWDRLIEILQIYLKDNKNTEVEIFDILGQSYIKTDQIQKALSMYLKLYDSGEPNKIVLRRIATLYAKLGDLVKAEHFIVKMNSMV